MSQFSDVTLPPAEVTGRWIWTQPEDSGSYLQPNTYARFRKAFEIAEVPPALQVRVTADSRFRLFINGRQIARGPVRCEPTTQSFQTLDLAPYLQPGPNLLAALVHFIGESTAFYVPGRPGFWLDCPDNPDLSTGTGWQGQDARDYRCEHTARILEQMGWSEHNDARLAPEGWLQAAFDAAEWNPAVEVGIYPCEPWTGLVEQEIPALVEHELAALGLKGPYTWQPGHPQPDQTVAQQMRDRRRWPIPEGNPEPATDLISPRLPHPVHETEAQAQLEAGQSVVIDMGVETAGYLELDLEAHEGVTLDASYGEYLDGDGSSIPPGFNMADRYVTRQGRQIWQVFEKRGFRYVTLDAGGPVRLHAARVFAPRLPFSFHRFRCSDPRLNEIWRLSAYTLQLNMEDAFTDCQWRERGQWLGDARVEALMSYYTFGGGSLVRRLLLQVARSMSADGKVHAFVPTRNPCYIPTWSLCYPLIAHEYHVHTGDIETLRQVYEPLERSVQHFDPWKRDGLLQDLPDWIFIDWAPVDTRGACAALNAFYCGALRAMESIAHALRNEAAVREWAKRRAEAVASFSRLFWDPERQAYADAWQDGRISPVVGQAANSCAVHFGAAADERIQPAMDAIFHNVLLPFHWTHGPHVNLDSLRGHVVASGSPYMSFYVLGALRTAGRHGQALDYIRRHWGRMLEDGATVTQEMWQQQRGDLSSRAHGWSAAPAYDLPAWVLGVQPLEPGWAALSINPHMSGLQWAQAAVPTPHGVVHVTVRGNTLDAQLPEGVRARVHNGSGWHTGTFTQELAE